MKVLSNNIAIIEGDQFISKWVEDSGRLDHDQNTLPLLLPFINESDTVIDIGAYIGDHTIAYARKAREVHAFEPNDDAYRCLKYNMAPFPQVKVYGVALGCKHETYILSRNEENPGASFLSDEGQQEVTTRPLDMFLFSPQFIKIDAEGMEVEILQGAQKTIKKYHPKLFIEVNSGALERQGYSEKDIFYFLDSNGYLYRNIYQDQEMEGLQYDIICW